MNLLNLEDILMFIYIFLIAYSFFFLSGALAFYFYRKKNHNKTSKDTLFSVIIPARNEEHRIIECLNSIISQDYPANNFEVIIVDDQSEDNTAQLIQNFISTNPGHNINFIRLSENNHQKKGALIEAIKNAKHEYIITRDADTTSGPNWLASISHYCQTKNPNLLIAPVSLKTKNNLLGTFQQIEQCVLQSSGGGMAIIGLPYLCNGANLVFKKSSFHEVNGYEGNLHQASGDDIFLLEKFRRKNDFKINYISDINSIVFTKGAEEWSEMFMQKSRWVGKFSFFANPVNTISALLILFTNLTILFAFLSFIFFNVSYVSIVFLLLFKFMIDTVVLILSGCKFNFLTLPIIFVLPILIPTYSIIIFNFCFFKSTKWKGR